MSKAMIATLEAMEIKAYNAKEQYKQVDTLDIIKVDANNRVVTAPSGGNSLKIMSDGQAMYLPLRKDVPINKAEYTIGLFEAVEDIEFEGNKVPKGTKKAFVF